jgi:hypothetical protein
MAESLHHFALHLLKKKQQLVMMATPATTLMTPCEKEESTVLDDGFLQHLRRRAAFSLSLSLSLTSSHTKQPYEQEEAK